RIRSKNRPALCRFTKIIELARDFGNACVEYGPGKSAGLPQDFSCLLRVAVRLITKAPAVTVDLNATLHDRGPGDQDVVRRRDRAVTLIGAKVGKLRAEC